MKTKIVILQMMYKGNLFVVEKDNRGFKCVAKKGDLGIFLSDPYSAYFVFHDDETGAELSALFCLTYLFKSKCFEVIHKDRCRSLTNGI